jgi:hypothetical protein
MRMLFVMLLVLLSAPAIGQKISRPTFVTEGGRVIHDIPYNEQKKVIDRLECLKAASTTPTME